MKPCMLRTQNLKKRFENSSFEVLKGIDLEIFQGESIAIIGKSGEGKSTLLQILGTLELPSSGLLEIAGKNAAVHSLSSLRNQHIGFIFQSYNLLENDTVLENVLMPAKIARVSTKKGSSAHSRALKLLEKVGLSHRIHFLTKLLSGGEKQRVAIARALCNDPEIILADEPSGNLDSMHSQDIQTLLIDLTKHLNKTLVVVTHDKEFSSLCDRIFVLKDGLLSF